MSVYVFTPHVLANPQAVGVVDGGVGVVSVGKAKSISYEQVAAVHLWFDPTRFDASRYRCRISARNGEEIVIHSTTCRGLGDFASQAEDYRALMLDLHVRLATHGVDVRYQAGVGGLRYVANVGCMGLVGVVLAIILLTFGFAFLGPFAFFQLFAMLWFTPRALRWVRRNRPVSYVPTAIPSHVLPPAGPLTAVAAAPVAAAPVAAAPVAAAPVVPPPTVPLPTAPPVVTQAEAVAVEIPPAVEKPFYKRPGRRYIDEDFGPIAEDGDTSWCSAGGHTTHWSDAADAASEANLKLDAGLIGPPKDPPPQGTQPL